MLTVEGVVVMYIFIFFFRFEKTSGEHYSKDDEGNKTEGTETK